MHTLLALTVAAALAAEPVAPELAPTEGLGWTITGGFAGASAFATAGLMAGIVIENGKLSRGNGTGVLLGMSVSALSGAFIGSLIGWWAREHSGGRGGIAGLAFASLAQLVLSGVLMAAFSRTTLSSAPPPTTPTR